VALRDINDATSRDAAVIEPEEKILPGLLDYSMVTVTLAGLRWSSPSLQHDVVSAIVAVLEGALQWVPIAQLNGIARKISP
jgi:hypothetical protein